MRFYEIVARMTGPTGLIIQSYWYRDVAAGVPNEGNLTDVTNVWRRDFEPKLLGNMPASVILDEVAVYGYRDTWEREPYLPRITAVDAPGVLNLAGELIPFVCAIYAASVEPVETSPKLDKTGAPVERPVRRGYWAHGPLSEEWLNDQAALLPVYTDHLNTIAYRDQLVAPLFDAATMVTELEPIRVGKPRDGQIRKGYGLVKGVVLRSHASTRRSRMWGKGR